ncbi:hypothetical protein Lser_V15G34272 [Lactuca serriola]
MAPSNRHRRLMVDSTISFCNLQCDPERNPTGICFPFCAATCPSFCRIADYSPPPSSSPSPANSPYSQPAPPAPNHPKISFPLKLSLLFLIGTFIYTLYKFYTVSYRSKRHRTPPPVSPENQETLDEDALDHHIWYIRTTGLQLSVINAITIVKFKKGDHGVVVGTECSVCLTEFEADEMLRVLPYCKHGFHLSCIDTWLRSHTNCPLCRAGIVDDTVEEPLPEQNADDLLFPEETDSRISYMEDDDREEGRVTSGIIIGSVSMEDFATSDHRGIQFQSVDGGSEIELVQMEQRTYNNSLKIGG